MREMQQMAVGQILTYTTLRWDTECTEQTAVNRMLLYPTEPLADNTNYGVALSHGIKSENGNTYAPSATWGLVRQLENPVGFSTVTDEEGITSTVITKNLTPFRV